MPPPEPSTSANTGTHYSAVPNDYPLSSELEPGRLEHTEKQQNSTHSKDTTPSAPIKKSKIELRKEKNAARYEQAQKQACNLDLKENDASIKEASARETSFIDEFLADTPQTGGTDDTWRQTTLDRLSPPNIVDSAVEPRRKTDVPVIDVMARNKATMEPGNSKPEKPHEPPQHTWDIPPSCMSVWTIRDDSGDPEKTDYSEKRSSTWLDKDASHSYEEAKPERSVTPSRQDEERKQINQVSMDQPAVNGKAGEEWLIEPDLSIDQPLRKFSSFDGLSNQRKSTADILKILPEDDLDFLSASDIRASMGRSKDSQQDKAVLREKLEADFKAVHKEDGEIHPMTESKILNNQHVRRKERELLQIQGKTQEQHQEAAPVNANEVRRTKASASPQSQEPASASPPSGSVLETSLDFMSRWLHTGGNVFAQHFWQDPVQVAERNHNGVSEDPFFKGVIKGIQAGRRAMSQVRKDLAVDVPASRPLLARLNANEATVLSIATRQGMLRTSIGTDEEVNRNIVRKLRRALVTTDEDYQKACEAIDSMLNTTSPSEALKRRLRHGADILQKNAKLSRMMIFGLQTRFEKAGVGGVDHQGRDLVQHILALHDTQTALTRLVERVMQAYSISAKAKEAPVNHSKSEPTTTNTSDVPTEAALSTAEGEREAKNLLRNMAANAKLNDEVSSHKAAMRGLSDDGYARPPKIATRKPFDGPNPLAHSLFRPFSLQLESLGKDVETETLAVKAAKKKEKADKELVKEVREAYEDVYGPITVEHRQAVSDGKATADKSKGLATLTDVAPKGSGLAGERPASPTIQMLKEDEISPNITAFDEPNIWSPGESTAVAKPSTQTMKEDEVLPTVTTSQASATIPVISTAASDLIMPTATTEEPPSNNTAGREPPDLSEVLSERLLPNLDQHPEVLPSLEVNSAIEQPKYTIYTYDAQFDEILVTSSEVSTASQTEAAPIALHDALTTLSYPSKFLPHLPSNVEIVTAKPDMLIVRSTLHTAIRTTRVAASTSSDADATSVKDEGESEGWKGINPIDGTARLSPTGFVGDGLDLERDFDERRKAAGEYHGRRHQESLDGDRRWKSKDKSERKDKSKGGVGGVMKTAIVAGATCYVVGVAAELVR
jgi:hypothetical protein